MPKQGHSRLCSAPTARSDSTCISFALALDGVYVRDEKGELQFRELSAPTTEDVAQVAAWRYASLLRVLKRHGRSLEGVTDAVDPFATDQPVLASYYGASAADVQLLGPAAGRKTAKLVRALRLVQGAGPGALAEVGGVNIHAAVAVDGRDRQGLERLYRYIARVRGLPIEPGLRRPRCRL